MADTFSMGKAWSFVSRRVLNYNVQRRAERKIDRIQNDPRPSPAPLHATEERVLAQIQTENPELRAEIDAKHAKLDGFLKSVRVTSHDPELPEHDVRKKTDHLMHDWALPASQRRKKEPLLLFQEPPPDKIPRGKVTLRQAVELMNAYQDIKGPRAIDTLAANDAAQGLQLDKAQMAQIVRNFGPFVLQRNMDDYAFVDTSADEVKTAHRGTLLGTPLNEYFGIPREELALEAQKAAEEARIDREIKTTKLRDKKDADSLPEK